MVNKLDLSLKTVGISGPFAQNSAKGSACYPTKEMQARKFWSPVARVDNAYGDRNLVCSCPPLSSFEEILGSTL